MNNILEVNNLGKIYNEFQLKDINFSLPYGFIMGLIGENGAGKTTTIKAILNMISKDSGDIAIFGKNNIKEKIEIKKNIGAVFDSNYFVDSWKIKDVEKSMRLFYDNWDNIKFKSLISKFNISTNKKISQLSKGMQMKLMLACALSYDAKLLILDEPTSGLDPVSRDELLDILKEYIEDEKRSVLFSTHITTDLEKIADYITYLHKGRLIYSGGKEEFIDAFRIAKGGRDELVSDLENKLISTRVYSSGFEGLIKTEFVKEYPNLLFEPASIDDIIVYSNKGDILRNE